MEKMNKETHIIYKTVDITTGEYYIGLRSWRGDQEPNEYFGSYKKDSDWRPDKKNLVRITLAEYPDRETLKDEEVEWIRPHLGEPLCKNTHNRRLHFDNWDKSLSTETRAKIGVASKGRTHTEESRAKISLARKGGSSWNKGKPAWNIGKTHTEETIEKMSLAKKGKINTIEHRENISLARKGKPQPKVACCYCDRLIGNSNIVRHQEKCKKNTPRL